MCLSVEPFSFLGLKDEIHLLLSDPGRIPLRVRGQVPGFGMIDLELKTLIRYIQPVIAAVSAGAPSPHPAGSIRYMWCEVCWIRISLKRPVNIPRRSIRR